MCFLNSRDLRRALERVVECPEEVLGATMSPLALANVVEPHTVRTYVFKCAQLRNACTYARMYACTSMPVYSTYVRTYVHSETPNHDGDPCCLLLPACTYAWLRCRRLDSRSTSRFGLIYTPSGSHQTSQTCARRPDCETSMNCRNPDVCISARHTWGERQQTWITAVMG